MASVNPNHLPEDPPPDAITLGSGASTWELGGGGGTNFQSIQVGRVRVGPGPGDQLSGWQALMTLISAVFSSSLPAPPDQWPHLRCSQCLTSMAASAAAHKLVEALRVGGLQGGTVGLSICSFQKLCVLCPSGLQLLIPSSPFLAKDDLIYGIKNLCCNAELIWALAVSVFLLVRMVTDYGAG